MFKTQKETKSFETTILGEIKAGIHVPDSASVTVREAGEIWLQECKANKLEAGSLRNYGYHLNLHILPLIGKMKLSRLTRPAVEAFKNRLLETGRSRTLAAKVLISLKGLLSEAQKRGLIVQNVALGTRVKKLAARHEEKAVIPTKDEIRAIIAQTGELWHVSAPWRAITLCALFTGLRESELRGLTWDCVDFEKKVIRVRQRADFQNKMASPKSKAGRRDVPMSPMVCNTLRQWKLACPQPGTLGLVFPTQNGGVIHGSQIRQAWYTLLKACDLSGYRFHDLPHVAASLFIEQGWQAKKVQTVMGHSSVTMTFDLYGHLWASEEDDAAAMAQIEARLLR